MELLAGQRQGRETQKAIQACNDWLRLGPGRLLTKLRQQYTRSHQNAPTLSLDTLKTWSSRYSWQERASEYDTEVERQKNETRRQIMETGLALDYERVVKLQKLAAQIEQRLPVSDFSPGLIREFRLTLDDLAKETGGRRPQLGDTEGEEMLLVWLKTLRHDKNTDEMADDHPET